jgi:hypothetical protein
MVILRRMYFKELCFGNVDWIELAYNPAASPCFRRYSTVACINIAIVMIFIVRS